MFEQVAEWSSLMPQVRQGTKISLAEEEGASQAVILPESHHDIASAKLEELGPFPNVTSSMLAPP
jgi:hypothetical protein